MKTEQRMRIGQFAQTLGVSVDAIRFYERRGVLEPAPRTSGGFRTFDKHDLHRVRLARQLQRLGLTVAEVVDALADHQLDTGTCSSQRWRLEEVETRIEEQIADLKRTRRLIRETLAACVAGRCELAGSAPSAR